MNDDKTPENIALRFVGAGDAVLLAEARRLVAEGIREDRRSRSSDEGVREVLRDVVKKLCGVADEHKARAESAGDRRCWDETDEAEKQAEVYRAAAVAVNEELEAQPGAVEKTIRVTASELHAWPKPIKATPRAISAAGPGLWTVIRVIAHDPGEDVYTLLVSPKEPL